MVNVSRPFSHCYVQQMQCMARLMGESWWRHHTFRATSPLCGEFTGHRWMVNSPHKGQWRGALMFCLVRAWTNSWANSGDADDLRRHRAHDDVTVISWLWSESLEFHAYYIFFAAASYATSIHRVALIHIVKILTRIKHNNSYCFDTC